MGLTPLSPANDHVNLSAAALGTDEPLAPIENGGVRAVSRRHLGRVGLNLMLAGLHQTISRTWAAAAAPSVIGGP